MNPIFLLMLSWFTLPAAAQHITNAPKVEEASVSDVTITKVEVTAKHTAVYLRFEEDGSTRGPRNGPGIPRLPLPPQQGQGPRIWIDPNTRLYKPGDVNTKFRFIRAEGIPTNPEQKTVRNGEVVEFVVYFEPVTPGIEEIDFYEGRSVEGTKSWNFFGIHIINPDPKKKKPQPVASKREEPARAVNPVTNPEKKEPLPAGLSGLITDSQTGKPVAATLQYVDEGDTIRFSTSSGKYRIAIEQGKPYEFQVTAKGYVEANWQLEPSDSAGSSLQHDFRLIPLVAGTTFTLERIYFETSKYTLLKESFRELDKLVALLRENPSVSIRVEGHSDNVGDFDKNVALSKNRAEAVRNYLVSKGIASERVEAQGYGPTKPVSKGNSEEERQKNRRVEIVIMKT